MNAVRSCLPRIAHKWYNTRPKARQTYSKTKKMKRQVHLLKLLHARRARTARINVYGIVQFIEISDGQVFDFAEHAGNFNNFIERHA